MIRSKTSHQLAYLTSDRMVAWKCLSLQRRDGRPAMQFAPVAYTSRSACFFPEFVNRGRLRCSGVSPDAMLWVITCPVFKLKYGEDRIYPPTLVARIVVEQVVSGEVVRQWGSPGDCALDVPTGDDDAFQKWRRATSVGDQRRQAIFRITRDFARLAWKTMRSQNRAVTQLDAWKSVRTAVSNPEHSRFLANTDATACLSQALGRADIARQPLRERRRTVAWQLMSPRKISTADKSVIGNMEKLAAAGVENTIFLNYRWNRHADKVASIGLGLLAQECGVWLDRLQIPDLKSHPVWRLRGMQRRKDPPTVELEHLLHNAIQRSSLFLSLASDDYENRSDDDPSGENWAQKERKYARSCRLRSGVPELGLVDLGGAPESLKTGEALHWRYYGDALDLAGKIARAVHADPRP